MMDSRRIALEVPDRTAPKGTTAFHTWRGLALTLAASRREIWRTYRNRSTDELYVQLVKRRYQLESPYRDKHIKRVDLWYARLIRRELRGRGEVLD